MKNWNKPISSVALLNHLIKIEIFYIKQKFPSNLHLLKPNLMTTKIKSVASPQQSIKQFPLKDFHQKLGNAYSIIILNAKSDWKNLISVAGNFQRTCKEFRLVKYRPNCQSFRTLGTYSTNCYA